MLQTTAYKHEIPWHCRLVMFVSHKNCHLDQLTAVMCEIKVVYSILLFKTYCCKLTNNSSHYKITISYLEFWAFTDFIHYVEGFYIRQSISEKRKYVVDINHWVLLQYMHHGNKILDILRYICKHIYLINSLFIRSSIAVWKNRIVLKNKHWNKPKHKFQHKVKLAKEK